MELSKVQSLLLVLNVMEKLGSTRILIHVLNALHSQIVNHATLSQMIVCGVTENAENGEPFLDVQLSQPAHVMYMIHAVNVLPIQLASGAVKETELALIQDKIAQLFLIHAHVKTTQIVQLVWMTLFLDAFGVKILEEEPALATLELV